MKVRVTLDFDDEDRLAHAQSIGKAGKSSHADMVGFVEMVVGATLAELISEYDPDRARRREDDSVMVTEPEGK